jgi:hypothetical protein
MIRFNKLLSPIHKLPLYGKILLVIIVGAIIVSGVLFVLYKSASTHTAQLPEPSTPSSEDLEKSKLASLKTSALKKPEAGDQKAALEDLQAGLALAKKLSLPAETLYFEQQIDYAQASQLPSSEIPAPEELSTSRRGPGFVTR